MKPNKLEPTPEFQPLHEEPSKALWSQRPVQIGLFSLLIILLAVVVFALPNLANNSNDAASGQNSADDSPLNPASAPALNSTGETPWQTAQSAKERREAQDLLAELLEAQKRLEEQQVSRWAPIRYQQALATANSADEFYKQGQFKQAQGAYQQTLEQLQTLIASTAEEFKKQLALGDQFLEQNNAEAATKAFQIASVIDTGDSSDVQIALARLKRAGTLDEVNDLLNKGIRFEKQQKWENAIGLYQQAAKLDPSSTKASSAVAAAQTAITQNKFNNAMSTAYAALTTANFKVAKKQFSQALSIDPSAKDAKAGLQQANEGARQSAIQIQIAKAQQAARSEQWQQAAELYKKALALDSSDITARVGGIGAQARLQLDKHLISVLDAPDKLQDKVERQRAQQLIDDAEAIKNGGERLYEQIAQLRVELIKAKTPISLLLTSDGVTEVRISRLRKIGSFEQYPIELTPGSYTAVGTRAGYRDVRTTFTVAINQNADKTILISCTERI